MESRLRTAGVLSGVVCLLAWAAMVAATFLPFVGFPLYDGLQVGSQPPPQATGNLLQGYDARWVVATLIVLGVAAAGNLAGYGHRVTAAGSLMASAAALVLALLEGSDSGWRVLPGNWGAAGIPDAPTDVTLGAGYHVFLVGAVVALAASLIMVAAVLSRPRLRAEAPTPASIP